MTSPFSRNRTNMSPEPLVVPLNCLSCGGAIEVACEVIAGAAVETVRFVCPYCSAPRDFEAPGRVIHVAARQVGEGPSKKH